LSPNSLSVQEPSVRSQMQSLPLAILSLTERCNSRCVTCDYWRTGRDDMSLASVERLLPSLLRLRTQTVLVSGGEPLVHPQWQEIAQLLRANGIQLWLLTSGLSLVKHARRVSQLFDAVTVSLDGTHRETYRAIRGLDAFDNVCAGIEACASAGIAAGIRVTLQRSNYQQLPRFVDLARELGARQVSFLAVDVANPHAFGRSDAFADNLALRPDDLPVFEQLLSKMESTHAADFNSKFIAESPQKLRRLHQYFAAVCGTAAYPLVRCNAPDFSAVIGVKGTLQPCFFISGPPGDRVDPDVGRMLNTESMLSLRDSIRMGERAECTRCVCSSYREGARRADFLLT
jgi:MoaA/NifB/PqqE/SkfB family radical SAM enzyme